MPRKRKKTKLEGAMPTHPKKVRKRDSEAEHNTYCIGDRVLCHLEMNVWWPGYICDVEKKKVSVGFFNEVHRNTKTLSQVVPFDSEKSAVLILSSKNILRRKKNPLLIKYDQDLKKAQRKDSQERGNIPTETDPQRSTPTETYPQRSISTETKLQKSTPTETYSQRCTPAERETRRVTSTETDLQRSTPTETKPQKSTTTETYPQRCTPAETVTRRVTPTETDPTRSIPTGTYQKRSTTETYPQRSNPTETEVQRSTPTETGLQRTSPTETYPQRSISTETKPQKSTPTETYPQRCTPAERETRRVTPTETDPTRSIPTGTYQKRSTTETYPQRSNPTETEVQRSTPTETGLQRTSPTETELQRSTPTETYPQRSTPTDTYPQRSTPTETDPQKSTPTDKYLQGSSPTETYPQRSVPTETKPQRSTPTETKPQRSTPTETDLQKSTPTETYPQGSTPTETDPQRSTPTDTYPQRSTPTETDPQKSTPTETFPQGASPTETYPQRSVPTETKPQRSTHRETDPQRSNPTETELQRATPTDTDLLKSTPTETYPQGSTPTETDPQRSTPRDTYPQRSTPTETDPQKSTPTETFPQGSSPTETYPQRSVPTETKPQRSTHRETDPQRSNPTETELQRATPTDTDLQKSTPTETYPQGSTPTETDPQRSTPRDTYPQRSTPTETDPQKSTPTETFPQGSSPTETDPQRATPTDTDPQRAEGSCDSKGSCSGPSEIDVNSDYLPNSYSDEEMSDTGRRSTSQACGNFPGSGDSKGSSGPSETEGNSDYVPNSCDEEMSDTGRSTSQACGNFPGSGDSKGSSGPSETEGNSDYVPNSCSDEEMSDVYELQFQALKAPQTEKETCKSQLHEIEDDLKILDANNAQIFIRKYIKEANLSSKHGRTYDRRHACYFCKKMMTNIQTHYQLSHKNKEEVKEIMDLKRKIDETKDNVAFKNLLHKKQKLLRNKGNHLHNTQVSENKSGEIILSRRKDSNEFDLSLYGPCPFCQEWIILDHTSKHQTTCPGRVSPAHEDYTKGSIILQAKIMKGQINSQASKQLKKEVFSCMRRDGLTELAQNDSLIVSLGDVWLMKNIGNRLRRKNFTSFRMRLSAKLLQLCREETQETEASMNDFINPCHFDTVVKCALGACKETVNEELMNPSTAIKMGYDLSRLASLKLGFSIKKSDEEGQKQASDFLKLLSMEWGVRVNKIARVTLEERHFNKPKNLPFPKDIVRLSKFLVQTLKKMNLSEPNEEIFRRVTVYTEARLLLYNRRRPGELESLSVDAYRNRSALDEADIAMRQSLTEFEQKLLDSQDLVEIRGKTGRGVPLLIPQEVKRMLEFLSNADCREKGGIKPENGFMFGNKGDGVIRAGDALNEVKQHPDLKLEEPSRILATNLRKYTATIAQVLNLNEQEMKWVCNHLGHTMKIHDHYYRQTSGSIERIDVAKMLLLQEHNMISRYSNKKLSDVQMDDIIQDIEESQETSQPKTPKRSENHQACYNFGEQQLEEPRRAKVVRVKWSEDEERELMKYFEGYFMKRIKKNCPSQQHCKDAIIASKEDGGTVHLRSWETIKKKVSNMLLKCQNKALFS